jgi:protein TonB
MNRELPLYFLGALMIHGSVLWAWAQTPTAVIGAQEPPAVEIEISEEQPQTPLPEPAKAEPADEMPPALPEKAPDPSANPEPTPEPEAMVPESLPAPQPTPQAQPQPRQAPPRPVPTKPRAVPSPVSSNHTTTTATSASHPTAGSGRDRSHASWKHRVTPSYPASALLARKAGRVLVTVQINTLGQATAAAVTTSSGNPVLDAAAVRAARESIYFPKCVLGVPLPDTVAIPYNFGIMGR